MSKPVPPSKQIAKRFIAETALAHANELPLLARADVYQTVGDLLGGDEGSAARLVAFDLRQTEKHQITLEALLKKSAKK